MLIFCDFIAFNYQMNCILITWANVNHPSFPDKYLITNVDTNMWCLTEHFKFNFTTVIIPMIKKSNYLHDINMTRSRPCHTYAQRWLIIEYITTASIKSNQYVYISIQIKLVLLPTSVGPSWCDRRVVIVWYKCN